MTNLTKDKSICNQHQAFDHSFLEEDIRKDLETLLDWEFKNGTVYSSNVSNFILFLFSDRP